MWTGLRKFLSNGIRFFRTTASGTYVGIRGPQGADPATSFYLTLLSSLPAEERALTVDASGNISTAALGSGGSVTSVAIAVPSFLNVSGSPITTSGTLTLSLASQTAGTVFASPAGTNGAPTFRAIAYSDLSALVGTGSNTLAAGNDGRFHTQNTDTGTTNATFLLDSDAANPVRLKNNAGVLELRNTGDTAFVSFECLNLTVHGTTTTVNSETVAIADNVIVLNSDVTGTPSQNGGIELERGTSTNAAITWNESSDVWGIGLAGSEIAIARNYQTTFLNANLVAGVLTVTHNLGNQYPGVTVIDDTGKMILPDDVTYTSTSALTVDLTSFGTIANTWRVTVIG